MSFKVTKLILGFITVCLLAGWHESGHASAPDATGADAEALIKSGHWKRARAILEPQVRAYPQDARSCYVLAQVKAAFEDFDGALTLAQHAVDLDGKNSGYHLQLGIVYGHMAERASMLSAGPLAIKFRKEVEIALQLDPKNLDALDAMMQFKYQAPVLMGGDRSEARVLADKIAQLNPSAGYLARAELAEVDNDQSQLETDYVKAAQANPRNYEALTNVAKFYSQPPRAKLAEAAMYAEAAEQVDASRIDAHWILARVCALEERWGELEHVLAKAEKDVPDDLRPFYEAAQASLDSGKELPRAEAYAKKYLSQDPEGGEPDAAEAHRLLGLLLAREGRNAEGRAEIQLALRIKPNFKAAKDDLKNWNN